MSIIIRPAGQADVDTLATLNRIVQAIHAAADPKFFRAEVEISELKAFFGNLVTSGDSFVLLAEWEARPVGYVWFDVQETSGTPFTLPQNRMRVHHLVVHGDARRRGIASVLMETVKAMAASRGVSEIILNTWSFNEGAQAFFRAAGFDPMSVAMRRSLISDEGQELFSLAAGNDS